MPKVDRWKDKVYSQELMVCVNQSIQESERALFNAFFNSLIEEFNLTKPNDLMMLDIACYDFLRIKRLQGIIMKQGDVVKVQSKSGQIYTKANEASFLLNAVETQFRNNMRELMLTRKEQHKKELGVDSKDFASWLSEKVVNAEFEVKDGKNKEVDGKVRERPTEPVKQS